MLSAPTWKRIRVINHRLLGEKIVEWTLNPATRPRTIQEFQDQLTYALQVIDPTKTTKLNFIDTPMDTILIRLPPKEILQEAKDTYSNTNLPLEEYGFPPYYEIDKIHLDKLKQTGVTAADLFYSSVGDYTTSECA
jgi:hypothetical protein